MLSPEFQEATKHADIHGNRYPVFDADAVKELLPTWRAWGQVLINAEKVSDGD